MKIRAHYIIDRSYKPKPRPVADLVAAFLVALFWLYLA